MKERNVIDAQGALQKTIILMKKNEKFYLRKLA